MMKIKYKFDDGTIIIKETKRDFRVKADFPDVDEDCAYGHAIDGLVSLVATQVNLGINIQSEAYEQSVKSAMQDLRNSLT